MSITVVGGGISGVACAREAAATGHLVALHERAHVLGGRMATRTLRDTGTRFDGRVVDFGASYFTVSDPGFGEVVGRLVDDGVAWPWTDSFHVAGPDGIQGVSSGPMRYAAPHGLRSVVTALARQLDGAVHTDSAISAVDVADGRVVVDGHAVDAAALCMPLPQARRVCRLAPDDQAPWEPVLAVTCVFNERRWADLDGVFVNDDPVLTWIADDGSRRGDGAPVLVAHVHPVLSARHLDDPASIVPAAVATLQRVLAIRDLPDWVDVHRWTFAKPLVGREEGHWLLPEVSLGGAGDEWAGGPRVEAAWLSGRSLGQALVARLG